jgi:methylase of polypeptide subunit release factors
MTPRLGAASDFSSVREFLHSAGYTEDALKERMGIGSLSQVSRIHASAGPDDLLDSLICVLLLGCPSPLPGELTRLLAALGLGVERDGRFTASVELYPLRGLYFISDRTRGAAIPPGEDRVFSAISPQTEDFLAMLPETRCPALLELCAGAGAAALSAASRYAVQAFAYDLSARSTLFAEFNARLNGVANFTAARGDMYQPAGRRTFDRIVAHPPYVPTLRSTELLRDGGQEGDTLTRRAVQGLPAHLHPGGRLYCLALVARRKGERVPERVRGWLGHAASEFDVVVIERGEMDPARFVFDNWHPRHDQPGDIGKWQALFRERQIESFGYSSIVIERAAAPRPARTIGMAAASPYPVEAVEALFAPKASIDDLRPLASPGVTMCAVSRLDRGEWKESLWRFECPAPFRFSYEGPAWIRDFLARCDGQRSCAEHRRDLGLDGGEFEAVVRRLLEGGVLRT